MKKILLFLTFALALPAIAGYETGGNRDVDMRFMAWENVKDNTTTISPTKTLPTGNPIGCTSGSTMDSATWNRYPIALQQSFSMDDFATMNTNNSNTIFGRWHPPEGGQDNDHSNQGTVYCGYLASTGVGETPTGDRTGDTPACWAGWYLYGGTSAPDSADIAGTTINEAVDNSEVTITVTDGSVVNNNRNYAMIRKTAGAPDFTHVEWVRVTGKAGNDITVVRSNGSCSGCNHLRSTHADTNNTPVTFVVGDYFLEIGRALGGSAENLHHNSGSTAIEDGAGRRWNEFVPYYLITRGNQYRDQNGVLYDTFNMDAYTWDVDLQMRGSQADGDYNVDLVEDEGVVVDGATPQNATMTRSRGYHDLYENYRALAPNAWLVSGQLLAYDWYWGTVATLGDDAPPNALNGSNTEGVPRGETGQHNPNPDYELFDGEVQAANMHARIGVRPRLNVHIEKGPDSTNPSNKDGYVKKFIPVSNTKAGLISANITGSLTPGDALTFTTSGATATLDAVDGTTLSISAVSATNPVNGEPIQVAAVTEATTTSTFTNYLSQGNRVPRLELATILMSQAYPLRGGVGATCYDKRGWNYTEDSSWGKTQHHDFMAVKSPRNQDDAALTSYAVGEAVDRGDNNGVRAGYGWLGDPLHEAQSVVVFDNPGLWATPDVTYTFDAGLEGWTSNGAAGVSQGSGAMLIERTGDWDFSQAGYGADDAGTESYTANQPVTIMLRMKTEAEWMRPVRVQLDTVANGGDHNVFLVHDEYRWYRATITPTSTGTKKLFIYIGKWERDVSVDEVRIYKNLDTRVWWQQYEHGLLLMNATKNSYNVNTFALTGQTYKEFTRSDTPTGGVSTMDPDGIHDGSFSRVVTLPAEDGRILWKPAPPTGPSQDFSQDLESYWSFDEASGSRADAYGNNDTTDNNSQGSTTGLISNAGDLNDTGYQTFGDLAWETGGKIWVNFDIHTPTTGTLSSGTARVLFGDFATCAGTSESFCIFVSGSGNRIQCRVNTDGTDQSVQTNFNELAANTTYNYQCVYDHSDNTVRVKINNGTEKTSGATTGNIITGTTTTQIANSTALGAGSWIDNVFVGYFKPTAQDQTDAYNSGAGYAPTP